MKWLYGVTIGIDLVFMACIMTLPRSGMESMGTAFILLPIMFLRLAVSFVGIFVAWGLKRKPYIAYALLGLGIMAGAWTYGLPLSPQDEPLYQALWRRVCRQADRLAIFTDQKAYDARLAIERLKAPDQAEFCRNLTEETDLAQLKIEIAGHSDLAGTCVTRDGDRVGPILHVIMDQYGPFPEGARTPRDTDWFRIHDVVKLLIDHGVDPNGRDRRGNTPLHYAVRFDNKALAKLLLAGGACVFLENDAGASPLTLSGDSGMKQMIRRASQDPAMISQNCPELLGNRSKTRPPRQRPDASQARQPRLNPTLVSALRGEDPAETLALLRKGVDPRGTDGKGSALHVPLYNCYPGATAMLQLLLDQGLDINARDIQGRTPLLLAVRRCSVAVAFLLDHGADPTIGDRRGGTALHYLIGRPVETASPMVQKLLDAGLDIDPKDKLGRTPLIAAGYSGVPYASVKVFLDHGADPNAQDARGDTLLHVLAKKTDGHDTAQIVALLIANGADVNIEDKNGIPPLVWAAKRGKPAMAEQLLNAGANVNVTDERNHPLVLSAISCPPEQLKILQLLIGAGADVRTTDAYIGTPPLAKALDPNIACADAARILLNAGVDPNVRDRNGQAPIHQLAFWTRRSIAPALKLLMKHGARLDIRDQRGMTALLLTARWGNSVQTMRSLLDNGADPAMKDDNGNTLLHCVAMNSYGNAPRILDLVLSIGGNPNAVNDKGQTPLDLALKYRNIPLIKGLSALKR